MPCARNIRRLAVKMLSMSRTLVTMLVVCAALLSGATLARGQEMQAMLEKLPSSPRLFLLRGEEEALRQRIELDPQLKAVWELVLRSADRMLEEPVAERKMEGRRLLGVSRQVLRRMTHLGLAYRLTGEKKYAQRGREEMLAAAGFTDWNPSHFLDVAEMTAGLAIGLDWLDDSLDEPTRETIRAAIISKGLEQSIKNDQWSRAKNNWNQVCNAGMALGAMMVAKERPELAEQMVKRAIETVPLAMHEYAPDGAYPEGPMYWDYGTSFNVLLISALQKALGSDFGLLEQPGFDRTADYFVQVKGPTGLWFNYADCSQAGVFSPSPAMHYLAAWQDRPGLLQDQRRMLQVLVENPAIAKPTSTDRLLPMLLIWSRPGASAGTPAEEHYVAKGMTPVATFRTSWEADATFAAIKAGQGSAPHGAPRCGHVRGGHAGHPLRRGSGHAGVPLAGVHRCEHVGWQAGWSAMEGVPHRRRRTQHPDGGWQEPGGERAGRDRRLDGP